MKYADFVFLFFFFLLFISALVGSLGIGMTFLLSPVAGILTEQIGLRSTTFLGGTLAIGGLVVSSFSTDKVIYSI